MTLQVAGRAPNEQQAAAIAASGEVFVSAGAGTGKTTVLVERFVRAVCEEGLDVESLIQKYSGTNGSATPRLDPAAPAPADGQPHS